MNEKGFEGLRNNPASGRAHDRLPLFLRRLFMVFAQPESSQFMRFAMVGGLGFIWDTGTVYLTRPIIGLTSALLLGFLVACSINWVLNRLWTYRDVAHRGSMLSQWLGFLSANSLGFLLNRGTALTLAFTIPLCAHFPVIPIAAGALVGLTANFKLSRALVFKPSDTEINRRS